MQKKFFDEISQGGLLGSLKEVSEGSLPTKFKLVHHTVFLAAHSLSKSTCLIMNSLRTSEELREADRIECILLFREEFLY